MTLLINTELSLKKKNLIAKMRNHLRNEELTNDLQTQSSTIH